MKEAEMWEVIEKEKANLRRKATQFGNTVVDNVPQPNEGKSRDIIAEKVSIGSGRTYE